MINGTKWTVRSSVSMTGHTNFRDKVLVVPRGDTPIDKAVRAHEIFHAMYSPPIKPARSRDTWEWLEENRIDWMVEQIGGEYSQGIRAYRQSQVNDFLRWSHNKSLRACAKAAIVGRGFRFGELVTRAEDRPFMAKILAKVSAQPSDDEMAEMAHELDLRFEPGTDHSYNAGFVSYTGAKDY